MTHFSMGERDGRNVRKKWRQQDRRCAETERGQMTEKLHMIHACKFLHAHTQKHRDTETQSWSGVGLMR